jgi:hypothetical protein
VNTGGILSFDHDTVLEVVAVLPHASVAVHVLVCVVIQPTVVCALLATVIVGLLQISVAVAVPKAASIVGGFGFPQINKVVPVAVTVGGVKSSVQLTVNDVVAVFPHASLAVHVLTCDRVHPVDIIAPSLDERVGVPHASVAVAVPKDVFIVAADGLHPALATDPVTVIVGGVTSFVQVTVLVIVAVLPQPSVAVNVLVCDLVHAPVAAPSLCVIVVAPQASVAVAAPSAAVISEAIGLHPSITVV